MYIYISFFIDEIMNISIISSIHIIAVVYHVFSKFVFNIFNANVYYPYIFEKDKEIPGLYMEIIQLLT